MEDQFIHCPVRAEMELRPETLKLVDDQGSALVGTEFASWLAPNCQRQLSIVVLPDNNETVQDLGVGNRQSGGPTGRSAGKAG